MKMLARSLTCVAATAMLGCGGPPPPRDVPQAGVSAGPEPDAAASTPAAEPTPPREEYVRADPSTALRGQPLSGTGYLGAAMQARTHAAVRTTYFQIDKAMSLFQATNDRPPESHEEFMEKIIAENQIQLPKLPEGEEYVYDPDEGELMVRRTE